MRGRIAAFAIGRAAGRNDMTQQQAPVSQETHESELSELAKLHNEGALTDEEFAKAKKKVLQSG